MHAAVSRIAHANNGVSSPCLLDSYGGSNWFEFSLQEICLVWVMFHFLWFKRHMYYVAYVWQTIYCEKFTVEETGHFTSPCMFGEDGTSIRSTIMFKTRTES